MRSADALDGLADEGGDAQHRELEGELRGVEARAERDRVRHDEFVELGLAHQALHALRREREVRDERMDALRAVVAAHLRGVMG